MNLLRFRWRTFKQRTQGQTISTRTRLAESFLNALTDSGWAFEPASRTITYVSGTDESAIDYWLYSSQVQLSNVHVGGSVSAQHRPVSTTATFTTLDAVQFGMVNRDPNFYFPRECFMGIRRRLLRLASNLANYRTPDELYDEILDSFTSFGTERRPRSDRVIPQFPWTAFLSDFELEVCLFLILLYAFPLFCFYFCLIFYRY